MALHDPAEKIIFDFRKPQEIKRWRLVSDKEIDGASTVSLVTDSEGHAVFSGNLSLHTDRKGARAGYVAMICEVTSLFAARGLT